MNDTRSCPTGRSHRGLLVALAHDRRGNVLAMSAAALIPLLGMVGGAIDLSRLYMARTRLQQACDAGALAGRKAMDDPSVLAADEAKTARKFFDFNFPSGTYSSSGRTRVYTRGASPGVVSGTASVDMPVTIMKIFGYDTITLNVTCESTLTVPNTDVMFVLDVTGSMADTPNGDTVSKIAGLKQAVKDFYAALGPGTASGAGRVRYGFMPYSANVNVGKIVYALNHGYIAGGNGSEQWSYQSRVPVTTVDHVASYGTESAQAYGANSDTEPAYGAFVNDGNAFTNLTLDGCKQKVPADTDTVSATNGPTLQTDENPPTYPDNTRNRTYSTTEQHTVRDNGATWTQTSGSGSTAKGTCQLRHRDGTYTRTKPSSTTTPVTWTDRNKFDHWNFQQASFDVSSVVNNASATNPTYWSGYWSGTDPNLNNGHDGSGNFYTATTPSTISWNGCIEEAHTNDSIVATSSLTPPSDANDLDIDLIPTDTATRWKPFLPDIQFQRDGDWLGRQSGWIQNGFAPCPRQASALTQYVSDYVAATKTSAAFNTYVDSLSPIGGTYHDIGLIWGARFLSPTGIFSATNSDAVAPGGFQVSRHIVFMTDGTLDTRTNANDPWGITRLDGRVAPTTADNARNNETHSRRVDIICNSMKSKGFTIWVVGFGISTLPQQLSDCATDANHASTASNSSTLRARFQTIAQTIGGLRLSQ